MGRGVRRRPEQCSDGFGRPDPFEDQPDGRRVGFLQRHRRQLDCGQIEFRPGRHDESEAEPDGARILRRGEEQAAALAEDHGRAAADEGDVGRMHDQRRRVVGDIEEAEGARAEDACALARDDRSTRSPGLGACAP